MTVERMSELPGERLEGATLEQLLASIDKKPEEPTPDEFDGPVDFDNIPEF